MSTLLDTEVYVMYPFYFIRKDKEERKGSETDTGKKARKSIVLYLLFSSLHSVVL
jgi:hypothetical protein